MRTLSSSAAGSVRVSSSGHLAVSISVGALSVPVVTGAVIGIPDFLPSVVSLNWTPGMTGNVISSVALSPAPTGATSECVWTVELSSIVTGKSPGGSCGGSVSLATVAGVSSVVLIGTAGVIAAMTGSTVSLMTSCHGHDVWSVIGITVVLGMSG